ncbi:fatty acid desaturase family protein [Tessaracoccus antarcticus]|uniref:Acyl-CoA desaturase n=1 Tax=Tessaracoccus antarcticus TaxID=2479848 RepID=A0A3M0GF43_9ACTN|nr:acyl-CoA desaturase [Tessaracoccus antarcticus]RMB61282.1 acyl-CoA desaturase [Tessaracoccus antarcticus]
MSSATIESTRPRVDSAARTAERAVNNRITSTRPEEQSATHASGKANPIAHLSPEDIESIGRELDAIRDSVMSTRGADDANYIRQTIKLQRWIELSSRGVLLFSGFWPAFIVGTAGLTVAKILENTEIGHNILHGQWDWMRDPKIHSSSWEWDFASPAEQWKKSHNVGHHTYTNVVGMDDDLGYTILRVDPAQEWEPKHLIQPITNFFTALIFEYGIAAYDLDVKGFKEGTKDKKEFLSDLRKVITKIRNQMGKDYVLHPLLSGPNFLTTLAANAIANTLRNIWTHSVIFCGHFPEGVETFEVESIEGETRGEWYLRQMLGSANIEGSEVMHVMTGNLSHQIEHHLFPDMPSNRYKQVAPKIRELMDRHQLRYVTGPLHKQVGSAWHKVIKYSLPNPSPERSQLGQVADVLAGKAVRAGVALLHRTQRRQYRRALAA